MIIKLVRHGLSQANTREVDGTKTGDHNAIPLACKMQVSIMKA